MVKFIFIFLIFANFSTLSNEKIEINADQFTYDKDNTRIYATGNVEILDSEFKLFAEKVNLFFILNNIGLKNFTKNF